MGLWWNDTDRVEPNFSNRNLIQWPSVRPSHHIQCLHGESESAQWEGWKNSPSGGTNTCTCIKCSDFWNSDVDPKFGPILLCLTVQTYFDVEYIYGFVWWGVCKQSRWRHSVTEPSQDGGYELLWQRYDNNKMAAMRYYSTSSTVQT